MLPHKFIEGGAHFGLLVPLLPPLTGRAVWLTLILLFFLGSPFASFSSRCCISLRILIDYAALLVFPGSFPWMRQTRNGVFPPNPEGLFNSSDFVHRGAAAPSPDRFIKVLDPPSLRASLCIWSFVESGWSGFFFLVYFFLLKASLL